MKLSKIAEAEILRYMGMPRDKADEVLLTQIGNLYETLEMKVQAKVRYHCFNIKCEDDMTYFLGTNLEVKSKDLTRLLSTSNKCYIMAATLGAKVDHHIACLQRVDMLEALIANACAATRIESLCDAAEKEIMEEIGDERYLTMRYSPGYGDVPITIQQNILEVLEAPKRMGLTLTKASMLIPSKSVTAFIGIASEKQKRMKTCHTCHLKETCMYRKRGDSCGTT